MILPARYNMTIWKGATFREAFQVRQGGVDSSPEDLTGATAILEVRAQPNVGSPLYTLSNTNGRIILGDTNGVVSLFIGATDTAAITWTSGVYDLTILTGAGDTLAVLWGSIRIRGV